MKTKIMISTALGLSLMIGCATTPNTNSTNAVNRNTAVAANANGSTAASPAASPANAGANANAAAKKDGAHHEHKAPHDGTLVVFGEEFAHIELVLDKTTGKLTAYTLDGEAEKGVPVEQPEIEIAVKKPSAFSVKLAAVESTLSGSKKGAATEFSGQSDQLKNLSDFDAVVTSIKIKGRDFKNTGFNFPKGNEEKH